MTIFGIFNIFARDLYLSLSFYFSFKIPLNKVFYVEELAFICWDSFGSVHRLAVILKSETKPNTTMLRAPVLMRSIRNGPQTIRNNIRKLSLSKQPRYDQKDNGVSTQRQFPSASGLSTEFRVLITIKDRTSKTNESVFYKDDEDRFRQRCVTWL